MTTLLPPKFGPYGGQFVPETLMPALIELEAGIRGRAKRPSLQARVRRIAGIVRGQTHAVDLCKKIIGTIGRRANLFEARRPGAHGRAQDQQRVGTGIAREADGEEAHRCRDGRRSAWRGICNRRGVAWTRMCGVHGRRGYCATGAECLPHEIARRGSAPRDIGHADIEGCHQRSHPRLGDECGRHTLSARLGVGTASIPDHRARVSIGDRERSARTNAADVGRLPDTVIACVGGGSNAIGVFSGFVDDEQVELIGVEAGGSGIDSGKHAAQFWRRHRRDALALFTARAPMSCRMKMDRLPRPILFLQGWITRQSVPNTR